MCCCCCSGRCARIIIIIVSFLMILIGIGTIVITCIPQTADMFSFAPNAFYYIRLIGIIIGSVLIALGIVGILSTIPVGYCKICLSVIYIIGMKIFFLIFLAIFIVSLILQGVGVSTSKITTEICNEISSSTIQTAYNNIKSNQPSTCGSGCSSGTTIFTCSGQQTALLGSLDISSYKIFFDFIGTIESSYSCSGLCPGLQLNCFYFSDITKATSSSTLACIDTIISRLQSYALGICISSGIAFLIAIISFSAGYTVCCSKEDQ